MDKMRMESVDMTAQNIEKIGALFPNCITETVDENGKPKKAINFEILRQMLTNDVLEGDEAYEFTWVGKKAAIVEANKPIRKTLRPCPEESVNWDTTENLYIEGDNLEVLKLLQESYLGKVKMIYIDPPYNTGSDLLYYDNYAQSCEEYDDSIGLLDENRNHLFKNQETNGRFHSDWCSMIYPRLMLARNMLAEEGVLCVSIDDNELENLKKICDEVMGESCFVDCITWNKRVPKNDNKGIGNIHEYILVYVKSAQSSRQFLMLKDGLDEIFELLASLKKKGTPIPEAEKLLKQLYNKKGYDRGITLYNNLDDNYEPWGKINVSWPNADTFGPRYDVLHPKTRKPTKVPDRGWRWNKESFDSKLDYDNVVERYDGSFVCGEIWFAKDENTQPSSIKYLKDVSTMLLRSIISLKSDGGIEVEKIFDGKSYFSYPKPVSLLRVLINSIEEKDGLFMDFFSGSATTAHAVMQCNQEDHGNRKFVMVQLPEQCDEKGEAYKAGYKTICEIGKERIRRAGVKIKEENSNATKDLDVGFRVFKLDDSNMKDVYYAPADYNQSLLDMFESNIKDDRTDLDLLFGCLLEWGLPLSLPYTSEKLEGCTVHTY
ncbi:MAG: site-specific DNA-methyltransferase, partial [Bacteroidaceae bacterium]|nr:site-specific DNA-methyltransferase [Bacteroidaceae bacterium]